MPASRGTNKGRDGSPSTGTPDAVEVVDLALRSPAKPCRSLVCRSAETVMPRYKRIPRTAGIVDRRRAFQTHG